MFEYNWNIFVHITHLNIHKIFYHNYMLERNTFLQTFWIFNVYKTEKISNFAALNLHLHF